MFVIWEKASRRRHLGGGIWEEASGRRHLGGGIGKRHREIPKTGQASHRHPKKHPENPKKTPDHSKEHQKRPRNLPKDFPNDIKTAKAKTFTVSENPKMSKIKTLLENFKCELPCM